MNTSVPRNLGRWLPPLLLLCLHNLAALCAPPNLLFNGSFEQGGSDWRLYGDARVEGGTASHGNGALRLNHGSARQDVTGLAPGAKFTCTAAIKVEQVRKTAATGYAYVAVYQLDDFEDVLTAQDFAQKSGTAEWEAQRYTFTVAEGCRTISVRCGLFQADGTAWFDGFTLAAEPGTSWVELDKEQAGRLNELGLVSKGAANVAVLRDDLPVFGAPSAPDALANTLRKAGFGVALLNSDQLASPEILNRELFEVLVLPYGPSFPAGAADNFRRFLRQGGKFLSTGGYAFDNLIEKSGNSWKAAAVAQPPMDSAIWHCAIPAGDLRGKGAISFSGFLRAARVKGPGMAYYAVYQLAADGSLVEWKDVCQVRGTQDWREFRYSFDVNPKAATVDLRAGLFQCHGLACFDDVRLSDESGRGLLVSDFEQEFDPDAAGVRHWVRSNRKLCMIQSRTRHGGQRALKVDLPAVAGPVEPLNTRHGLPGDGLEVTPGQLGVFDADYHLERAAFARAAPEQCVLGPETQVQGTVQGYAASGVVGFDHARWIPLLNAYDRYGRLRGAAGAMLRHFAGTYAGSSWVFFGVTNRDLFAEPDVAMQAALTNTVRALARDTYFAWLTSEPACYRQGEAVQLQASIFNGGRKDRELKLEVAIYVGEPLDATPSSEEPTPTPLVPPHLQPLKILSATIQARGGTTNLVALEWKPGRFERDFYHVTGRLWDGAEEVDRIKSGFVVWDAATIASGPKLNLQRNYLRFGKRPLFLFGTDDWSYLFTTTRETPLQWLWDMRQRRDYGVLIYENLQFGIPASATQTERLLRKVDGVTQLAQKYQQVYLPGLLIGYNVAASRTELAAQKEFCRSFAKRYADVPGLVYYLNGDLACVLGDRVTPEFNEFLRSRYDSKEKLREAWGGRAPLQELGAIPAEDFNDWGHSWDNIKVYDLNLFRAWLIRRWSRALIDGIRESDTNHLTTSEFYQLPHSGVDLPAAVDGLDLANFGFFEKPNADLQRFPALCKFNDQRWRGKSTGPGEYGVKTHPAWADGKDYGYHIARTREQAMEHFLAIPHYALALGAARIHNWCWKDDAHRVFPWGLCYPCDNVPKDILYAHRNQSLLFRHFAPVYREPSVYVLTPDTHRFGGGKWQVLEGILTGIDLALATHVENLGTLNEMGLDIPPSARVIFFPLPFCPSDEACEKLLRWVRQGGVLYMSGDLSYDELRRRARTSRLQEFCGVRMVGENYPNISVNTNKDLDQPCLKLELTSAKALRTAPDGQPLVVEHRVGQGRVIFSADPIELHSTPGRRGRDVALYRGVLEAGRIAPIRLEPDDPLIHVFRVPLEDGGSVYVLFNTDDRTPSRQVTLSDPRPKMLRELRDGTGPSGFRDDLPPHPGPLPQGEGVRRDSQLSVAGLGDGRGVVLPLPEGEGRGEGESGVAHSTAGPVTIQIARNRPGLLWFDGRGALRAIEAQGECRVGNETVLTDETAGILLGLDGEDLRRSKAVLLMPLRPGAVRLKQTADWKAPVIEIGEVRDGSWKTLESARANCSGGELRVEVDADQAVSLLLMTEQGDAERWRGRLGRAMSEPGSLE